MKLSKCFKTTLVMAATLMAASIAAGQAPTTPAPSTQTPPADKSGNQQAPPLTLQSAPPSAEEDAAFKAFNEASNNDPAKKNQLALDFLTKYPASRYNASVYSWQVRYYYATNQPDKMEEAGDKELAIIPNDAQTLAMVGSTLPRAMNAQTPDPQKRLAKAEQYSQKALDLLPTMTKPDNMSDEMFTNAKSIATAMAYSGLGLVAYRRGKYNDALPNFEKAVKLDPQPDPVNYYLLGKCNQLTSHFDDAVTAFTKCADIPGGLQATCKQNIEEAKKLGATQLSAPK